jgi:hypothetical protein
MRREVDRDGGSRRAVVGATPSMEGERGDRVDGGEQRSRRVGDPRHVDGGSRRAVGGAASDPRIGVDGGSASR